MENPTDKQKAKEELEKEEAERKNKIEEAKKELGNPVKSIQQEEEDTDEQESDGSANAFENK